MGVDEEQLRKEATKRISMRREFWQHLASYVIVSAALIGAWAITGAGYFWPAWVLGGWGIGLVFHAWSVFGQRPVGEEEIQREMERLRRRQGTGS